MKIDRRGLLHMFGLGAAAVVSQDANGKTSFETLKDDTVRPLGRSLEKPAGGYYPLAGRSPYSIADLRREQLYSSVVVHGCDLAQRYEFFRDSIGTYNRNGEVASLVDTNMSMAGMLPVPMLFAVQRIGMLFSADASVLHVAALGDSYSVRFWLDQKMYWEGPLAAVIGNESRSRAEAAALGPAGPWMQPVLGLADLEPLPIIIQPEQNFRVDLETARGAPSFEGRLKIWAVLDGLCARSVQ